MRVIIAGGGTGGLATAIALRKAGIEPLVLEQASAFTAIGAGLGLYVNAMKALTYLGADAYWRENAARIDVAEQRGLNDDELITVVVPRSAGGEVRRALLLRAPRRPAEQPAGTAAAGVRPHRQPRRRLRGDRPRRARRARGGEEVRGDLLVGADGLRSATQAAAHRRAGGPVHRRRRLARADPEGQGARSATTRRSCPGTGRAAMCCCTRSGTTGTRKACTA